ncbi:hypothetical protein M407DRAFT_31349 [Tulasnella calospora MUT 4182]|uniref:Uncharacterized protein n=1 Tax=Tulasnella calospora MUT 4182 TaxID=1051891 RepID=A0A0C3Q5R5_9AGAM|nr:hypothetical protein M407DRAFT_31349 [Tulasnella calospora MUT 4182]
MSEVGARTLRSTARRIQWTVSNLDQAPHAVPEVTSELMTTADPSKLKTLSSTAFPRRFKWRDINQDLGAQPPGHPITDPTNPPFKPAKSSQQEHLDSDAETVWMSDPQADAWLDGPRTSVSEHVEKSKFLGEDVVNIGSSVVRILLSCKPVVVSVEAEDPEVLSIKRSVSTARSKDPFTFLPGLK